MRRPRYSLRDLKYDVILRERVMAVRAHVTREPYFYRIDYQPPNGNKATEDRFAKQSRANKNPQIVKPLPSRIRILNPR